LQDRAAKENFKANEAPRPPCYNYSQRSYLKPVHKIDSDGCGPPENWEKNFGPPPQERNLRISDQRYTQYNQRGVVPNHGRDHGRGPYIFIPPYCLFHGSETNHHTKYCPIFLESKRKMDQESNQPSQQNSSEISQPHHAMGFPPLAIFSILPFIFPTTCLPKKPSPSPDLLSIIPLHHN
jgi:hypothetical protein